MMDSRQRLRLIIAIWTAYGTTTALFTLISGVQSEEIVFCLILGVLVIGATAEIAGNGGIRRGVDRVIGRNSTLSPPSDG